jgi:hypothetical protein
MCLARAWLTLQDELCMIGKNREHSPTALFLWLFLLLPLCSITQAQESTPLLTLEKITDLRSSDPADSRLILTLKITGTSLDQALEYGDFRVNEPEVLTGKISGADPDGFAPLRRIEFSQEQKEAYLTVELPSPTRGQSAWPVFSGTLKLRTYRRQLVPIEQVLTKLNQTISDPLFKVHGIDVRVVDPRQAFPGIREEAELKKLQAEAVALEISGNTRKVRAFVLETAQGQTLKTRAGSFGAGRVLTLSQRSEEALPPDTKANVLIPISPEDVLVPFHLKNISLP